MTAPKFAPTPNGRALAAVEALEQAVARALGEQHTEQGYTWALGQLEHPVAVEAERAWSALGQVAGTGPLTVEERTLVLSTLRCRERIFGRIERAVIATGRPRTNPHDPPVVDLFKGLPR